LLTRIATTESVSSFTQMKLLTAFLELGIGDFRVAEMS
jgi:hypothetical protein